ncbi:MAG: HEAT repeat domain-containing protein [Actinomycetota bacterium]|nr:HEAT repeat domain-containing protein [Actinomycetota bacterium]
MIFFCPVCWREIKADEKKCPYCGADIAEHEKKNFEEKLINALKHPERETVKRSVWILGRIKSVKAVEPMKELFGRTDNPFMKLEILNSLKEIGTTYALDFISEVSRYEKGIVMKKAKELMGQKIPE